MAFSGGSYAEVGRWLWNFLTSHAKRVEPRAEVLLAADDERQGRSYGAQVRLGDRQAAVWEFEYKDVADNRGRLDWCRQMAEQTRARVRELIGEVGPGRPAGR
jgi:hypothetical protein